MPSEMTGNGADQPGGLDHDVQPALSYRAAIARGLSVASWVVVPITVLLFALAGFRGASLAAIWPVWLFLGMAFLLIMLAPTLAARR